MMPVDSSLQKYFIISDSHWRSDGYKIRVRTFLLNAFSMDLNTNDTILKTGDDRIWPGHMTNT